MATLTLYPSSVAQVGSDEQWTNPSSAYADDTSYATAAPGKNAAPGPRNDWGGFDAAGAGLPESATISAVTVRANYSLSGSSLPDTKYALAADVFDGATQIGGQLTTTAGTGTLADHDMAMSTLPTAAELRSANFKVRVEGDRGNTNTARTYSLDYLAVVVTYTAATVYQQSVDGGLAMSAGVVGSAAKMLGGSLADLGSVVTRKATSASLGGALASVGAMVRSAARSLAGALPSASAVISGTMVAQQAVAGAMPAPTAEIGGAKSVGWAVSGGLSASGGAAHFIARSVGGGLSAAGVLVNRTGKGIGGGLAAVGAVVKRTSTSMTGALGIVADLFGSRATALEGAGSLPGMTAELGAEAGEAAPACTDCSATLRRVRLWGRSR